MLQSVATDVWIADGPTVPFFGIPYATRMAVIRLPEGLWIWSPIALDDDLRSELAALGTVRWLVEPNALHHLFLAPWQQAFPDARSFATPGLRARIPDLDFDVELGDEPYPAWAGHIDQVVVHGSPVLEEVVFFHRPSSTCLVCDLVQRHDPASFNQWQRVVMSADGMAGSHGSTPREWRATFLKRGPAREALDHMRAWKTKRLIIAHGDCALEDGARVLDEGLAWIDRPWPL